jgi:hypothetical protein
MHCYLLSGIHAFAERSDSSLRRRGGYGSWSGEKEGGIPREIHYRH